MAATMRLGTHEIGDSTQCYVIAEIGHNHQGSLERARELFREAKLAGAHAVRKTSSEFVATSMVGDTLDWALTVDRVGGSSVALTIRAACGREERAIFNHLIVYASMLTKKAIALPEDLREKMLRFCR